MSIQQQLLDAFLWRHACKEFDINKKISQEELNFLFQLVRLSPSSFGIQPYELFILKNQQLLERLHPHMWGAQKQLFTCSEVVMFAVKSDLLSNFDYIKHIIQNIQKIDINQQNIRLQVIKDHLDKEVHANKDIQYLLDWMGKQAYIALGNLMTASAILGIDSCPIEGFLFEEVTKVLVQEVKFDINKYRVCVFCCLGYRLNPPKMNKTRKSLDELVHYI